jgi:hypothetical protein
MPAREMRRHRTRISMSSPTSIFVAAPACLALVLSGNAARAEDEAPGPASEKPPERLTLTPDAARPSLPRATAPGVRAPDKLLAPIVASLPDPEAGRHSSLPALAYVSFGVGAAGIGTGAIAGLLAATKRSDAECPGSKCTAGSEGAKDVDLYRGLHVASAIGFGVGLVGALGGVTLLFLSPSQRKKERQSAGLQLFIGPQRAGLKGRF